MIRALPLIAATLLLPNTASAAFSLDPASFASVTNALIANLGGMVGLGADYHAYEGATGLPEGLGLDTGTSITAIALPGDVVNGLTNIGIENVPHYLPLPKINVQKSIGTRLMLGTELLPPIKIQGNTVSLAGASTQYTVIDRPRLPTIALRAQANYADLVFVRAVTLGGDVVVSHKLPMVDTFAGAGYRSVQANISIPANTIPAPEGIDLSPRLDAGHAFAGATVRAGFARITTQADFTTRGVNTYGTKISFFF